MLIKCNISYNLNALNDLALPTVDCYRSVTAQNEKIMAGLWQVSDNIGRDGKFLDLV